MKAVFIHPSYPNQFTQIAYRLAEREGWDCAFLVQDRFTDQVRRDNPPLTYYGYHEVAAPTPVSYYVQCLEEGTRRGKAVVEALAHIRASSGLDVVVGHACFGTTFFVRELLKVPVVAYVELPGYFTVFCREEFPGQYPHGLIDVSLRALIHSSVLQSDLCVVPSRHAKRLFPPELRHKIRVQMEGFSLPAPVADRSELRRDLGLAASGPIVGFAGRTLEAVRGFDIFVKAAKRMRQARSDVRFLVLGDEQTLYGNEMTHLAGRSFKQHVFETEGVNGDMFCLKPFMPYEQFMRHLQAMDVIIYPLFEGSGNWGLFEAMASGVPVLASNRCFIPEAITHGRDGLLFDPRDVDGFAHTALEILEAPERFRQLGRNARRTIARRFSHDKAAQGYAKILREAVTRSLKRG